MRQVFWQIVVTLDGLVAGPNGALDWFVPDEDFNDYVAEMLSSIDGILVGRVTYEGFAGYWPSSTDAEAPKMNALPKIVFSRTLESVDWKNSRLVKENVHEEISKLKQQPGKDIALFGSANLASTLMRLDLIDEYRIVVSPVVLGAGIPMFRDVKEATTLTLAKTQTLRSGAVILHYRR